MKKIITSSLLAILMLTTVSLAMNAKGKGGPGSCESKIETVGPVVIVTMCGRTTSFLGQVMRVSCDSNSLSECQFSNLPV